MAAYLCGYLLQDSLFRFRIWRIGAWAFFFLVEAILWYSVSLESQVWWLDLLQKLFRMRAALSLSLSSVVGQKASEPSLLERRLTGAPSLSTHPYSLSKPALPPVFVFCQRAMSGKRDEAARKVGRGAGGYQYTETPRLDIREGIGLQ